MMRGCISVPMVGARCETMFDDDPIMQSSASLFNEIEIFLKLRNFASDSFLVIF